MKDRSTSHLRVFVGGLQDNASIDELYDHFLPYGEVQGIVVNRGFGFVQFAEEAQAQKAINEGNGTHFQGKVLAIKASQSNPDRRWDQLPCNLYKLK